MNEALPSGAQSLEAPDEPTTTVGVVSDPTVPVVEDPAAAPVNPDDADPEGTVIAHGGVKLVPLAAVQAERGKRKDAEARVATLADKAAKYDQTEAQVRQVMPIIERVRNRPDVLAMLDKPPAPVETRGPMTDAEAVEYAKDFDLYKPDGTPDLDRAQRIVQRNLEMNARQVQQQIAPVLQTEAQRQSHGLFNHYANVKDAGGNTIDPKVLAEFWKNVPAEMSAQPGVAQVLYLAALGSQTASGKQPPPKPSAVVVTESAGGRSAAPASYTALDQSIAKHAGISEKDYKSTASRYQPGGTNSLE